MRVNFDALLDKGRTRRNKGTRRRPTLEAYPHEEWTDHEETELELLMLGFPTGASGERHEGPFRGLGCGHPPAQPAAGRQSRSLSDPALDSHPSLASHLLACLQRQLPDDWQQRYRQHYTRCCRKRSARRRASRAPAIAPPIGSIWARRKAAASSIRVTGTTSQSTTYSSNPSARTGSISSTASPSAVFHGPIERLRRGGGVIMAECLRAPILDASIPQNSTGPNPTRWI